ncbi:hypothetical protein SKAU_G00380100 [Synaphobranchus kaupii]|uniref:Uncharacterized protein n=1 Tax=Synaphobranchus kaupii TaxID=118154 RepID=A0A9Q1EDI1_SYNKA|nr:hypothetical protein SKAU_G00380100 [Synaphobranchus kaupii]
MMAQVNEEQHDEIGRRAGGILAVLEKFSTFYGLRLSLLVFSPIEQLSRTLQTVNITLQDAQRAVKVTRGYIQRQRSDNEFENFYKSVTEAAVDLTEAPVLPRQARRPRRLDEGEAEQHSFQSPTDFYKRQYFEVLDLLDSELGSRFEQRDIEVAVDLEKLIVTAANGEDVSANRSGESAVGFCRRAGLKNVRPGHSSSGTPRSRFQE